MRICVGIVLIVLLLCTGLGVSQRSVFASNSNDEPYPWLGDGGSRIISKGPQPKETKGCSGRNEEAIFRSGYRTLACIYGETGSTRVASYTNQGGLSVLGIAYPGENEYSEVYGVCEGSRFCAYSASRDILIDSGRSRFYGNFAKNLTKTPNPVNGLPYYQFSYSQSGRYISVGGPMIFNAVAVSGNGKWAVVEAYEYGFVRVDLDTFHERRIAISGARYGVANDPGFELAISNSGRDFAAVGDKTGVSLYQIDNYCGDVLNAQSMYYFLNPTVPCRQASSITDMLPGFISAHTPHFNGNGTRFGITVKQMLKTERIIVAPISTISVDPTASLYMALGDSYSSGEGETDSRFYKIGTDEDTNACHLSRRSYPYLMIPIWGLGNAASVACSGAQIKDIFGPDQYYGQKHQVSREATAAKLEQGKAVTDFLPGVVHQLDFVDIYQPKIISVGIGGNDAGLMDKLNSCIGPGVCEWAATPRMRLGSAKEIQSLYGKIRAAIAAIHASAPDAKVIYIGYPTIINESSGAHCSPVLGFLLSREERQFMDESIKLLNTTIRAAAVAENALYVDIQDVFVGHRLCEGDASAMNGLRIGDDIAPIQGLSTLKMIGAESFHPTPFGHTLIANRLFEQIPNPNSPSCLDCHTTAALEIPTAYWTEGVVEATTATSLKGELIEDKNYIPGQPLAINIPVQSFRSESEVEVRFREDTVPPVVVHANDSGGVTYELPIPKTLKSGYYAIRLLGMSWSGDPIDMYQVVRIVDSEDDVDLPGESIDTKSTNTMITAGDEAAVLPVNLKTQEQITLPIPVGMGAFGAVLGDNSEAKQLPGVTPRSEASIPRNTPVSNENASSSTRRTLFTVAVTVFVGGSLITAAALLFRRYITRESF